MFVGFHHHVRTLRSVLGGGGDNRNLNSCCARDLGPVNSHLDSQFRTTGVFDGYLTSMIRRRFSDSRYGEMVQ